MEEYDWSTFPLGRPPKATALTAPGTTSVPGEDVQYVEECGHKPLSILFKLMSEHVAISPPREGGVLLEPCWLILPTGDRFRALTLCGSVRGWRRQVTDSAKAVPLMLGRINEGKFCLDDGRVFELGDCGIEYR